MKLFIALLCLGILQFAVVPVNAQEKESPGQEYKNTRWYKLMQKPDADYFLIRKLFDKYIKQHPSVDGPRETGEEWFGRNIYYLNGKGRVQAPPSFDYKHLRMAAPPTSFVTDTVAGDWHMTGPRNQVLPGENTRGGFSYCVRMDPTNTQKMFISFQTGGLWVTSDGGIVWHLTDANMPDNKYYNIEVCAANPNIVYAISQSAVIKSVDGGYTWTVTGLNSSVSTYSSTQGYALTVSPANPNIVVARWGNALYRSTDGGSTWTSVLSSLNSSIYIDGYANNTGGMLEWSNNDTSRVFFIDEQVGGPTATIYTSSNAGGSFTTLATITIPTDIQKQDLKIAGIATASDQPSAVFAFLNSDWAYIQLYKVDVGSGAVTLVRKNMVNNHSVDAVAMDIKNSNHIVFGGYGDTNIFYSTDGGQTFATSSGMHYDIRSVYAVGNKVIVGNDGETVVSTDSGAHFNNVTAAISNIELWGFGSSFKSDILAAGCNHGPLKIRDYAAPGGWYHVLGADQQNTDVNPLDSVHVISRGYDAYYVTRTGIGAFTSVSAQVDPGREDWFNNLSYHPNLYNTILSHTAGNFPQPYQDPPTGTKLTWRNSLLRSDNNGLTVGSLVHTFSDRLMSEKICMRDTSRIYCIVSSANNHLWKTTDGGATFTEITPGSSVIGSVTNISDVAVSDVNSNEIWVTYSGVQNTCKVLHSTDGGATYTNLTTAVLGLDPIRKIVFQRGTNGGVYVGNRSGVFYRNNSMSNWQLLGTGLPMCEVRNMFINYYKGKILLGTSRGAWDHDLYEHSSTMAQISASTRNPGCQSSPTVQFRDYSVVSGGGSGATYSWTFQGGTPATSTSETPLVSYANSPAGNYNVSLTVTDQYGTSTQSLPGFITYNPSICCAGNASGWTSEDIGSPSLPGTTCYQSTLNRWKVQASGADIWNNLDQFRYCDTALNGNGQILAKVTSLSGPSGWTKAGVMIRETTAAGSKHAFVLVSPGNGISIQYRTATGGSSFNASGPANATAPYWVMLVRTGNLFSAYASANGVSWTLFDTVTIVMNASVRIGLALTSHDNTQLATAVFDSVNVSPSCVAITTQPVSSTNCPGTNASFNVAVAGAGNTYQWLANSGGGWYNEGDGSWSDGAVSGSATTTLVKTVNASTPNGKQWRLQVTNGTCGTMLSNIVTLTVPPGVGITSQPVSMTSCMGSNALFTVGVSATGGATYQWQSSTNNGGSWSSEADGNWPDGAVYGSITPVLQKEVNAYTQNGRQWRLQVTGSGGACGGSVYSNPVTLTVTGAAITTQPASQSVAVGGAAIFSATVAGTGNVYQWETNHGGGWYNEGDGNWGDGAVSGSATSTLTKTVNASTGNGWQWRLDVTNGSCPKIVSNVVTLTITGGSRAGSRVDSLDPSPLNAVGGLSVYPNPAHSELTIAGMSGQHTIAVYNSAGQRVYAVTSSGVRESISTAKWGNGVYLVKVTGVDGKTQTFEVLKN